MMRTKVLALVAVAGVICASGKGLAQTSAPIKADSLAELRAYLQNLKTKWQEKKEQLPDRPLPPLPDDIKKVIEDARKAAKEFATAQKELLEKYKDAEQEEREKAREELKVNWEAFKEAQKARIQELKQRLAEMKQEFKDNRDRQIDAGKEQGRDRGRN
jgi:hypothetical protein